MTVMSWNSCRERREIVTLVKLVWKNQSLCKVNMSWSWWRETRVVNVLKYSRWSSCFFFEYNMNIVSWTSSRDSRAVNVLQY